MKIYRKLVPAKNVCISAPAFVVLMQSARPMMISAMPPRCSVLLFTELVRTCRTMSVAVAIDSCRGRVVGVAPAVVIVVVLFFVSFSIPFVPSDFTTESPSIGRAQLPLVGGCGVVGGSAVTAVDLLSVAGWGCRVGIGPVSWIAFPFTR